MPVTERGNTGTGGLGWGGLGWVGVHSVLDVGEFELTVERESGVIFQLLEIASN